MSFTASINGFGSSGRADSAAAIVGFSRLLLVQFIANGNGGRSSLIRWVSKTVLI